MRGGLAQALRDLDHGREFRPLQLIDPYGLVTTYSYGSSTATLPSQVTDVTGRWLRFTGPNARLINRVESSAGQWIQWTRDYQPGKSKVDYWDGTTAYYEGGSISTTQRWVRFSDVRQTSSMRDVEYRLVLAPYGQFGPEVGVWEVVEEKHPVSGTVVSTRSVSTRKQFLEGVGAVATGPAINVTESRGDGPTRNFTFDDNYRLSSATNFRGHRSYFSNWHGGVPRTITDARGHITTLQTSGPYAKITRITHPDNNYIEYTWDGRYLTGERNENGYWTYYDRDAQKRVWRIRHRDSASETFEYNSRNQMTKHVLRSGAAEHWTYNSAGLVHRYWPPTTAGAVTTAPYFEYTYYSSRTSKDLVQTARDPRGNITTYEYNARGQVTKETFADSKYRAYGYDNWGNRLWAEDEDRRRTNYTYDVYNRLLTTTDPLNRAVTHTYEPMSAGSSLKHTRAAIRRTTTHANRKTAFVYDNDYNVVEEVRGEGTADSEGHDAV